MGEVKQGGIRVRPGDIVVADVDGVVIIDQDQAENVCESAEQRRQREQELMQQLQMGKTTLELLGLPGVRQPGPAGKERGV